VFVPDCRRICKVTAAAPLTFESDVGSAMPSSTLATSAIVTGWPSRSRTTIWLNSPTDCTRPRVRTLIHCGPVSRRPPGTSTFCIASARETSLTVRL
jgi:hypothetical protein